MKIFRLILFILFLVLPYVLRAQNTNHITPEIIPPSPDLAALGKFGDVPVSKYTGVPSIGVPIHTIDFDGLEIPIRLSYHAGGIRVNEESGWVGLGWTLTANAVITRSINGFDDLSVTPDDGADGYVYSEQFTQLYNDSQRETLGKAYENNAPIDTEPDVFTAAIFGENFKFLLKKKASGSNILSLTMLDNINVKGSYDLDTDVFELTDENGYKFVFAQVERSTTYRGSSSGGEGDAFDKIELRLHADNDRTYRKIMGWHLTKVISPRFRELSFQYLEGFHLSYPDYSSSRNISVIKSSEEYNLLEASGEDNFSASIGAYENVYLSKISGDFGVVDFVLKDDRKDIISDKSFYHFNLYFDPGTKSAKRLERIEVRNSENELIKSAMFSNNTYFNSDKELLSNKEKYIRLKLDKVTINDQAYSFEYELPNGLPPKDTKDQDFWGFYNGADNSIEGRIPSYTRYVYDQNYGVQNMIRYEGANRKSNSAYGKIGTLKRITYPTGGATAFEFEGNRAAVLKPVDDESLNYNYTYLSGLPPIGENSYPQYPISIDEEFTINGEATPPITNYNFSITVEVTCGYNCSENRLSSPVVKAVNVYSGEEITFMDYANTSGASTTLKRTYNLPAGTYKLSILPYNTDPKYPTIGLNATLTNASYIVDYGDTSIPNNFEEFEVGGLRITTLFNYDIDGSVKSKRNFFYTEGKYGKTISSGVLMNQLVHHSKMGFYDYTPQTFGEALTMTSGPSLSTSMSAQGSHVGYNFVKEELVGNNGSQNGYILTNYLNSPNMNITRFIGITPGIHPLNPNRCTCPSLRDVTYGNVYVLGIPPIIFNYHNGKPIFESYFDASGSEVKRIEYDYLDKTNSSPYMLKLLYQGAIGQSVPPENWGIVEEINYYQQGKSSLLKEVRTREFSGGGEFVMVEANTYDSRNLLKTSTALNSTPSEGVPDELKKEYNYSYNFTDAPYQQLTENNRIAKPVEVKTFKNNGLIANVKTEYGDFPGIGSYTLNEPVREMVFNPGIGIMEERVNYKDYDLNGNMKEYTSSKGVTISYRWSYKDKYPVLKAVNSNASLDAAISNALPTEYSTLEDFISSLNEITSNSTQQSQWASFNDKIRSHSDAANMQIYTYTYKPLIGITSKTGPSGLTIYYEFDESGRLKKVIDQNLNILQKNEYHYNQ